MNNIEKPSFEVLEIPKHLLENFEKAKVLITEIENRLIEKDKLERQFLHIKNLSSRFLKFDVMQDKITNEEAQRAMVVGLLAQIDEQRDIIKDNIRQLYNYINGPHNGHSDKKKYGPSKTQHLTHDGE